MLCNYYPFISFPMHVHVFMCIHVYECSVLILLYLFLCQVLKYALTVTLILYMLQLPVKVPGTSDMVLHYAQAILIYLLFQYNG